MANQTKGKANQPRWCKQCKNCAHVHKHGKVTKTCTIPGVHIPFLGLASLCNSDSKCKK